MASKATKKAGRPTKPSSEKGETFSIRLKPELRQRLEKAAEETKRSLGAEIAWRLEESFEWEAVDPTTHPEYAEQLQAFDEKVAAMESRIGGLQSLLDQLDGRAQATGRPKKK